MDKTDQMAQDQANLMEDLFGLCYLDFVENLTEEQRKELNIEGEEEEGEW